MRPPMLGFRCAFAVSAGVGLVSARVGARRHTTSALVVIGLGARGTRTLDARIAANKLVDALKSPIELLHANS